MIHLDDGVLRAHLDEELPAPESDGVRAHVAGCGACRARLARLRSAEGVVREALALLDGPMPDTAWAGVSRRLAKGGEGTARTRPSFPPLYRAAAILVLVSGGVAAAVVPGSPLRSLWAPPPSPPAAERAAAATEAADARPSAGIRAPAHLSAVEIDLTAPPGTEVTIVTGADQVGVFGPPSTVFRTEEGVLRADLREGSSRIEIPSALGSARIVVNGSPLVEVQGGRVVTAPPAARPGEGDVLLRFRVP